MLASLALHCPRPWVRTDTEPTIYPRSRPNLSEGVLLGNDQALVTLRNGFQDIAAAHLLLLTRHVSKSLCIKILAPDSLSGPLDPCLPVAPVKSNAMQVKRAFKSLKKGLSFL